jgi:hypothetical protein
VITLLVGAIGILGTWYAALRSAAPSVAKVSFNTGVSEGAGAGSTRSFATPKLHAELRIRLSLTPVHQDLGQVAITIDPPPSLELTSSCFYEVSGEGRQSCLHPDGERRIEVPRLASGQSLRITAKARVVHRVEGREAVMIEMSSADTPAPSQKRIDLYSPRGTRGEEAARRYLREEVHGPMRWDEPSLRMRDDVVEEMGNEWQFLDLSRLHGLGQVPYGRVLDVRSLISNRFLGAKIVTFRSIVRSAPLRVRSFRAAGSGVRAIKELFALGPRPGERDLWCATARSTAQPALHRGDRILVRAALIGWGLARPYGRPLPAAMLICPVVSLLDPEAPAEADSTTGGVSAPAR